MSYLATVVSAGAAVVSAGALVVDVTTVSLGSIELSTFAERTANTLLTETIANAATAANTNFFITLNYLIVN